MRYIKQLPIAALVLSFAFTFTACKKDKDDNGGSPGPSAPVTCKVNGTAWNSLGQNDKVIVLGDTANGVDAILEEDTLSISAVSVKGTDSTMIILTAVVDADRIGTYTLSVASGNLGMYIPGLDVGSFIGTITGYLQYTTGTLTISSYDAGKKTISGSFSFNMDHPDAGEPDYNITEGSFRDLNLR